MYDLVIRNGTVVDGTGLPKYRADVAVSGDRIAAIGRIAEKGKEEIDATGHVVTPGFIDGHTHMDAQVFWDPLGSCSCWHGVTTVVMGNCGFTLAPGSAGQRYKIINNIERAEDINRNAMEAAIRWSWTTFREYMDVVDTLPKTINYAANIGHSALRTHVMGERAFEQQATADDIGAMEHELLDALDAGAIGFTSSRSTAHRLPEPDNRYVASYHASWDEMSHLVCVMGQTGRGVFEYSRERDTRSADPAVRKAANDRLLELAVKSRPPITFGLPGGSKGTDDNLKLLDDAARAGGRMFGQTHTRGISHVLSFKGRLQFDDFPEWKRVRALSLEEQRKAFTDPEQRKILVAATKNGGYRSGGGEPRAPASGGDGCGCLGVGRRPRRHAPGAARGCPQHGRFRPARHLHVPGAGAGQAPHRLHLRARGDGRGQHRAAAEEGVRRRLDRQRALRQGGSGGRPGGRRGRCRGALADRRAGRRARRLCGARRQTRARSPLSPPGLPTCAR